MKNTNLLIVCNLNQIICQMYSLYIFRLNELNPSQRLPNVIAIMFVSQLVSLLISHVIKSPYYRNLENIDFIKFIKNMITSIAIYYALIVLMGAPFLSQMLNTFYLSVLLTIMTTVPLLVFYKTNDNYVLLVLINRSKHENRVENMTAVTALATLLGSWSAAFLIALDWMQTWQEWPVTSCLGAITANLFCNILCLCNVLYKIRRNKSL